MKKIILLFLLLLLPVISFSYELHYEDYIKYSAPTWTPDGKIGFIKSVSNGKKYVYGEEDKDVSGIFKLWHQTESLSSNTYLCTMNIDGTEKKEIMKFPANFYPGCLSWGKELVLISEGENPAKIATVRPNGKKFKIIAEGRKGNLSPDGQKMVYVGVEKKVKEVEWGNRKKQQAYYVNTGIWMMDIDGKNKTQLTDNAGDTHPLWGPDGKMIAFERWEEKSKVSTYIIALDKNNIIKIFEKSFLDWTNNSEHMWIHEGLIDFKGNIVKEYKLKINDKLVPNGMLSPDEKKIVADMGKVIYIGDINGNEIIRMRKSGQIEYGKRNRKQKNNIWIKE